VTNSGLLNPRYASNTEFGLLTINGNYTETNSANINIQLGGTTAGTNFDQVDINGNATFDGTLNVSLLNNFTPTLGSTFDVLTYDSLSFLSNLNFTGLDINSTLQFLPQWFNNKLTLKVVDKANATNITVTTNQDVVNASDGLLSLREAVIEANQNGSDNTIILGAQTYNLSFSGGSDDNFAATGDLDILPRGGRLTIRGQGANQTFISTSNLANIFEIHSGATINFQDVTIITSVTLALSSASVTEDGTSNLVYTFTRAGVTSNALTVNYTVGGTATFNSDYTQIGATSYTATTGTITFAAGATTATLTIDPTADTTVESDETVALTLASGIGYTIGTTNAVTGTITNDDTSVSLAVSPSSVTEDGTTNLVYTFTRTGVTSNALTVNYTVGGTATLGTDYTGISTIGTTKTVTFAANSSIATVTVDPTTDSTGESDETVALTLASGIGYTIGTTNAVIGTITDDDTSVSLAVSPSSVTEDGTTNLVYTFTRTGVTSNALTVSYTVGGTATFNTDYTQSGATTYTATTGTIAFAPGSTTASITIDPTADTVAEPNETIGLTLSSGSGYTISTPNTVTGTITDDDSTVTLTVSPSSVAEDGTPNILFTFTRTGNTTNPLTVNYTVGGTATFNVDYSQTGASSYTSTAGTVSFAADSSTATVTIDPTADTLTESDETVTLTLLPGSYRIGTTTTTTGSTISESASGGFGITEKLYYISSASGSFSLNYEMYSIPDKAEIFVNNVLTTRTNGFVSGSGSLNLNSVTLQTGDQVKVVITGNVSGTAWNYNVYYSGGIVTTTPAPVTSTIINNDTIVTLAVSPTSVTEDGSSNLVYTFTRTGSTTNTLIVNYTISGTATNGNDYSSIGTSLTFAAGSSTATLTVDPTTDSTVESDETVALTLASGTGYTIGTTNAVTGTITNDDLPSITLAVSPNAVTEDGTPNLIYTFTRTGVISNALTVNYTVGGTATLGTDYTGISTIGTTKTVTFAANSSIATVIVDPTTDTTVESDETVALTLASGIGYTIGTTNAVTGTITNDDTSVSLAVSPSSVTEDGTTNLVYTFTRTGVTSNALTVNYSITGTADSSDYTGATPGTGKTITFAAGASTATLTIDPTADTIGEFNETVSLTLVSGTGYTVGTTGTVTGTITNDDALTQIVTTLQDITSSTDGFLSLREAIVQANTINTTSTILLGEGRYTLATADDLDIQLQGNTLTIQGQGKDLTLLDANSLDRFFEVHSGATVIISGVTITNGKATFGGAIANAGTLTIRDSTITNNQSRGIDGVNGAAGSNGLPSGGNPRPGGIGGNGGSGGDASGGAIYNSSIITMTNTVISDNQAIGGRGGNGGRGGEGSWASLSGAPFIGGRGGNGGFGGNGGNSWGGGLFNAGQATLTNVTVGSHSLTAGTGGSAGSGGSGGRNASGSYAISGSSGIAGAGGSAWGRFIYNLNSGSISSNGTLKGVFNAGGSVVANDWAVVTVAVAPASVSEDGSSNLVYTFARTGSTTHPLSINYTVGGTATLGTDYTGISTTGTIKTLTFAAGASTATVTFDPTTDTTKEDDETVVLTLTHGEDYSLSATISATGTITNDDPFTGTTNADTLIGTTGADTLIGLTGNDTYTVNNAGDIVTESLNAGTDLVQASIFYTLPDNVENLTLTGTTNVNGAGNSLNNVLTGNSGNNTLTGNAGNDNLNGGDGIDILIGGLGNDVYVVDTTTDTITENANEGTDTVQSSVTYTLENNLENLTLTGAAAINGTGNTGNNTITGNSGNNTLNGGAGRDTLTGGTGSDTFVFQFGQSPVSGADRITDFAIGTDKIDLFTSLGVAMNASTALTRAANSTATTLTNVVNSVFTDANGALTGNQALGVNSATLVEITTASIAGTYLVINDGVAGFQSSNDLLVNITGYSGTLPALGSIDVSSFFI
jgi:Ca2+-binding RTX toxin-like protein